ncbi:hypothetical protein BX600DRAFT_226962 [Xylariales sp. PMI_506]|nr:hypothetical protein BX600DRAFT_226962 [Xylariales sp. PMI_506]
MVSRSLIAIALLGAALSSVGATTTSTLGPGTIESTFSARPLPSTFTYTSTTTTPDGASSSGSPNTSSGASATTTAAKSTATGAGGSSSTTSAATTKSTGAAVHNVGSMGLGIGAALGAVLVAL